MSPINSVDSLHTRLVAMYKTEGVIVNEVSPRPQQCLKTFEHSVMLETREPSGDARAVVAITKKPWVLRRHSAMAGIRCGAVVYIPNAGPVAVGYGDVVESVESMKTHLHKYVLIPGSAEEVDVCFMCREAQKDIQCTHCYASLCKPCFVMTAVMKADDRDVFECQDCGRESSLEEIVYMNENYEETYICDGYNEAILWAMREMDRTESTLTILGHPEPTLRTVHIETNDSFTNLQKHTEHAKVVKKMLKHTGTVFMVGDPPSMCDSCEFMHERDLEYGRVFEVTDDGIIELEDVFGLIMVLQSCCAPGAPATIRKCLQHGSSSD